MDLLRTLSEKDTPFSKEKHKEYFRAQVNAATTQKFVEENQELTEKYLDALDKSTNPEDLQLLEEYLKQKFQGKFDFKDFYNMLDNGGSFEYEADQDGNPISISTSDEGRKGISKLDLANKEALKEITNMKINSDGTVDLIDRGGNAVTAQGKVGLGILKCPHLQENGQNCCTNYSLKMQSLMLAE